MHEWEMECCIWGGIHKCSLWPTRSVRCTVLHTEEAKANTFQVVPVRSWWLSKDPSSCSPLNKSQECSFAISMLPNEVTAIVLNRVSRQKKFSEKREKKKINMWMPHSDVMSSTTCTMRCIWYYEPLCPFCDFSLQRHAFSQNWSVCVGNL